MEHRERSTATLAGRESAEEEDRDARERHVVHAALHHRQPLERRRAVGQIEGVAHRQTDRDGGEQRDDGVRRSIDWLPLIETTINDLVYAAIALFFLYSLPERLQRGRSLTVLHQLRSLAHVIDMHQLTKDPERLRSDFQRTSASVPLDLTAIELSNYLDSCSELLSMVGKTAALFGEHTDDRTTLSTIAGIEELTNGLSRKIWAKISLLPSAIERVSSARPENAPDAR
jgi:hypothetical protein